MNRKHHFPPLIFGSLTLCFLGTQVSALPLPTPPAKSELQAGDFIWPKKPGAIVPYDSKPGSEAADTAARWEKEKRQYLDQLKAKRPLSKEEKARFERLQSMTYNAFKVQYFGGRLPGSSAEFGTGNVATGHVGIIRIISGVPYIVEAMIGKGVQQVSYKDWLAGRPGEIFWLGRLKGISAERRATVADIAARHLKKPYNFWNFDLEDTKEFYCSKLAWLSILSALDFAPDDDKNSRRVIWYSPKQLMKSKYIQLIVTPGEYVDR